MSAILKSDAVFRVTSFEVIQHELNDYGETVQYLKYKLFSYSTSDYKEMSWVITKDVKNYRISFMSYKKYGNITVDVVKIFCILLLMSGRKGDITHLGEFFHFLGQNNIGLLQINKFIFIRYSEHLKSMGNAQVTSFSKFVIAKDFLYKLQGHPNVSRIDDITLIETPFPSTSEPSSELKYKVIKDEVLEKMDEYFTHDSAPVYLRVAYWLLRLYALRPTEVIKFPLYCVGKISDNMAVMRKYVAKGKSPIETKFGYYHHELVYLDLDNHHMHMLYKLMLQQQKIAIELFNFVNNNGLLFTYRSTGPIARVHRLSGDTLRSQLRQVQKDIGIPVSDIAVPRDFKKTGITHRVEFGWNTQELKKLAHHSTSKSIANYSQPSTDFIVKKQREVMVFDGTISERYIFRGKIVNGISDYFETKILNNPRAHKIADMGYCPDVAHCGNHFACIGCKDLIPDKELESYYHDQSMRCISISEKQNELGQGIDARDSFHRATLFAALYQRVKGDKNV